MNHRTLKRKSFGFDTLWSMLPPKAVFGSRSFSEGCLCVQITPIGYVAYSIQNIMMIYLFAALAVLCATAKGGLCVKLRQRENTKYEI
jgi:hypothetical protein